MFSVNQQLGLELDICIMFEFKMKSIILRGQTYTKKGGGENEKESD